MKIGIDLDEVLGHFTSELIKFHNKTYGTKLKEKDFFSYNFWDVWGGTREEAIQKVYDFHKTKYFKDIQPIKGAQKVVGELSKKNELFVITSRQNDIAVETKEWLKKYFPNKFSEVYFTNHFSQNGDSKTKKEVCDYLGIDILIEDSVSYANECGDSIKKIFLLNKPWNINSKTNKNITRVDNLKEILDKI